MSPGGSVWNKWVKLGCCVPRPAKCSEGLLCSRRPVVGLNSRSVASQCPPSPPKQHGACCCRLGEAAVKKSDQLAVKRGRQFNQSPPLANTAFLTDCKNEIHRFERHLCWLVRFCHVTTSQENDNELTKGKLEKTTNKKKNPTNTDVIKESKETVLI